MRSDADIRGHDADRTRTRCGRIQTERESLSSRGVEPKRNDVAIQSVTTKQTILEHAKQNPMRVYSSESSKWHTLRWRHE